MTELMASLRQLVAAESHALAGAATMQAAEGALARADPHDVIAACVRHYQQLFECPKLEGVISSMNRVCEAAERMVARLRRLDEVLPRYQRMASQLYELLR
ncbi:uncharacterized protein HaLaN_00864, partial [Haematococcus lacustris]